MTDYSHFVGTREVSQQHAIDLTALQSHLASHIDDFGLITGLSMFKGGQSNPTYLIDTAARKYVMRAKPGPVAKLLPSAHAIEREFAVMSALFGTGVPVAKMHTLCTDESVIGRAFYIMEYVQGRVMWDQALPELPIERRAPVYDEMNRVIAALHTVDHRAIGLESFGKPGNYFERQIGRWSKQYVASITQPIEEMDKLMAWLPANIPPMARDEKMVSIVHGDFRLDNLMFGSDAQLPPKILAVLDWELSTLGHPLADFSYHCMTWHISPGAFRGIGGLDVQALGIPTEAEYIRRYCERTGLTTPEALAPEWNFYMAYNAFRLSAILQGIAKRVEMGTAASAQAANSAKGVRPLAQLAWSFAQNA